MQRGTDHKRPEAQETLHRLVARGCSIPAHRYPNPTSDGEEMMLVDETGQRAAMAPSDRGINMTLIQGQVNTFSLFLSRVLSNSIHAPSPRLEVQPSVRPHTSTPSGVFHSRLTVSPGQIPHRATLGKGCIPFSANWDSHSP